jgi:hypothetical protein
MENRKSQVAIMGLLFAFMLVATAAIVQGPLLEFVELGINQTVNGTAHSSMIITLMNALPLFIWLVVLIAVVALITGRTT